MLKIFFSLPLIGDAHYINYFISIDSALGFLHMQSSFDRDNYIEILFQNISPSMHSQFRKEGTNTISHMGGRYDYASIMHYGETAFSSNGQITIKTKVNSTLIGLYFS